jgi:hypothetical protein
VGSTWWYAILEASLDDVGESFCREHEEGGGAKVGEGADELEEGLANSDNSVEGGRAHLELINLVRSDSFPNRGTSWGPHAIRANSHLNQVLGEESQDIHLNLADKLSVKSMFVRKSISKLEYLQNYL